MTLIYRTRNGAQESRDVPQDSVRFYFSSGWSTSPGGTNITDVNVPDEPTPGLRTPRSRGGESVFQAHVDDILWTNNFGQDVQIELPEGFVNLTPGFSLVVGDLVSLGGLTANEGGFILGQTSSDIRERWGPFINRSVNEGVQDEFDRLGIPLGKDQDPFCGRGGGGGRVGQKYVKPDKRLAKAAVQSTLVALTGSADDALISQFTDVFMSEDRRAFDLRESEQLDPMETVRERIRQLDSYKAVHGLRPPEVDEFKWVSDRVGSLARAGVSNDQAIKLGIQQATLGATQEDTAAAGVTSEFATKGKKLPGFIQDVRTAANAAVRLL